MTETWKDIEGYEGLYQISSIGRVRNCKNKILSQGSSKGYKNISLRKNKVVKYFRVHRLVANAFLQKVEGKKIVNHKDFNRSNNNFKNLEWCTQKENVQHAIKNKKFYFNHKDRTIKLSEDIINKLGSCYDKELAILAGVRREVITKRRNSLGIKSYLKTKKE